MMSSAPRSRLPEVLARSKASATRRCLIDICPSGSRSAAPRTAPSCRRVRSAPWSALPPGRAAPATATRATRRPRLPPERPAQLVRGGRRARARPPLWPQAAKRQGQGFRSRSRRSRWSLLEIERPPPQITPPRCSVCCLCAHSRRHHLRRGSRAPCVARTEPPREGGSASSRLTRRDAVAPLRCVRWPRIACSVGRLRRARAPPPRGVRPLGRDPRVRL